MPAAIRLVFDPTKELEVNIASDSPHVVAYKLWSQEHGGDWTVFADDGTDDDDPDFFRVGPFPPKTKLAYWLGIGGNPRTLFRARVVIGQEGRLLRNGTRIEEGSTNEQGIEIREEVLSLETA